jgi:hypothetical protein
MIIYKADDMTAVKRVDEQLNPSAHLITRLAVKKV